MAPRTSQSATLEFENGAVGDVFGSWTTSLVPEGQYYMVVGSKGTIHSTTPPRGRPGVGSLRNSHVRS